MFPWWVLLSAFHAPESYYRVKYPVPMTADWSVLLNTLLLAMLVLACLRMAFYSRRGSYARAAAGILLILVSAYAIAKDWLLVLKVTDEQWGLFGGEGYRLLVWGAGVLVVAHFAAKDGARAIRVLPNVLLVFLPILALNVMSVVLRSVVLPRSEPPIALVETEGPPPELPGKLVWIVFDELSENALNTVLDRGIELKEFRRFRTDSIVLGGSRSPSIWTIEAIPSLTTGLAVCRAEPRSGKSLSLHLDGRTEAVQWESLPSIFEKAVEAGRRVGLVGWVHPYCRMFGDKTTSCYWEESPFASFGGWFHYFEKIGVLETALQQLVQLVDAASDRTQHDERRFHVGGEQTWKSLRGERLELLHRILETSERTLRDDRLGFVFLHLPVPHPPGFSPDAPHYEDSAGYLGNLALADQALGQVRTALEEEGLWEDSTVILTSDHGLRQFWRTTPFWSPEEESYFAPLDDRDVPLMIKMSNQNGALNFDAALSTTIIYDFSIEILNGRITDVPSARRWLETNYDDYPPACLTGESSSHLEGANYTPNSPKS